MGRECCKEQGERAGRWSPHSGGILAQWLSRTAGPGPDMTSPRALPVRMDGCPPSLHPLPMPQTHRWRPCPRPSRATTWPPSHPGRRPRSCQSAPSAPAGGRAAGRPRRQRSSQQQQRTSKEGSSPCCMPLRARSVRAWAPAHLQGQRLHGPQLSLQLLQPAGAGPARCGEDGPGDAAHGRGRHPDGREVAAALVGNVPHNLWHVGKGWEGRFGSGLLAWAGYWWHKRAGRAGCRWQERMGETESERWASAAGCTHRALEGEDEQSDPPAPIRWWVGGCDRVSHSLNARAVRGSTAAAAATAATTPCPCPCPHAAPHMSSAKPNQRKQTSWYPGSMMGPAAQAGAM